MSRENVELMHRAYEAFNRRDLDAVLELMDPDVEAVSRLAPIEGGYRGHEGIRRWWNDLFEAFSDWRLEAGDIHDLGDDRVVAALGFRGHGTASEMPLALGVWHAVRFHDGRCTWWGTFLTEAEALEAVGLRE